GPTTVAGGGSFPGHIAAQPSSQGCSKSENPANVTTTNDGSDQASASITCHQPIISQITPTNTTCSQFSSGTSSTLSQVQYSVKSGKINQVNPGVFFYFVRVTAAAGANTVTINQAITTGNFGTFFAQTAGSNVFTAGRVTPGGATVTPAGGGADTQLTAPAPRAHHPLP